MSRLGMVVMIAIGGLLGSLSAAAAQTAQPATAQPAPAGQAAPTGQPAQAAQRLHKRSPHVSARAYDGLWSVLIRTAYGPCDPTYRYPARISGGRVQQAENDFSYQISGAVVASGAIGVTVYRGGQSATGYGRLRGSSGSGRWSVGGNMCYGTWSAMRRAAS
jgi:hypothetical protein